MLASSPTLLEFAGALPLLPDALLEMWTDMDRKRLIQEVKYPHIPPMAGKPFRWTGELYDADPDCKHVIFDAFWKGGGVVCGKCGGWFCF